MVIAACPRIPPSPPINPRVVFIPKFGVLPPKVLKQLIKEEAEEKRKKARIRKAMIKKRAVMKKRSNVKKKTKIKRKSFFPTHFLFKLSSR